MLLERGADANPRPHLGKAPIAWAYEKRNTAMIERLRLYGAVAHPVVVGGAGDLDAARRLLADEAAGTLPEGLIGAEETVGDLLGWSGAAHAHSEIVRLALPHIPWPREDGRWWWMLWHPLYRCLECFTLALERCDADVSLYFGRTILHDIVGIHGRDRKGDAVGFASAVLDAGGRLDVRDALLKSTPLGWACRWGLADVVKLFLDRGADPVEADAEPWATPRAWAERMHHQEILELLNVTRPNTYDAQRARHESVNPTPSVRRTR
jgi:ankyrin repeat protein